MKKVLALVVLCLSLQAYADTRLQMCVRMDGETYSMDEMRLIPGKACSCQTENGTTVTVTDEEEKEETVKMRVCVREKDEVLLDTQVEAEYDKDTETEAPKEDEKEDKCPRCVTVVMNPTRK